MALTDSQMSLLNSLMYMGDIRENQPCQVSDVIYALEKKIAGKSATDKVDDNTTVQEARDLIAIFKNDATLMNLKTLDSSKYKSAGDDSGILTFVDSSGEATVVFRGTENVAEWADNVNGLNQTDTERQQYAADYIRKLYESGEVDSISVTGHSKGGNKAQYVTIVCGGMIQRCVSFDGQGFSNEFFEKYQNEINNYRNKITAYAADGDYVNVLLNPLVDIRYIDTSNVPDFYLDKNIGYYHKANILIDPNTGELYAVTDRPFVLSSIIHDFTMYISNNCDPEKVNALKEAIAAGMLNSEHSIFDLENGGPLELLQFLMKDENADSCAYLLTILFEFSTANNIPISDLINEFASIGIIDKETANAIQELIPYLESVLGELHNIDSEDLQKIIAESIRYFNSKGGLFTTEDGKLKFDMDKLKNVNIIEWIAHLVSSGCNISTLLSALKNALTVENVAKFLETIGAKIPYLGSFLASFYAEKLVGLAEYAFVFVETLAGYKNAVEKFMGSMNSLNPFDIARSFNTLLCDILIETLNGVEKNVRLVFSHVVNTAKRIWSGTQHVFNSIVDLGKKFVNGVRSLVDKTKKAIHTTVTNIASSLAKMFGFFKIRDFSQSARQKMLNAVEEVHDEKWWDFTRWDCWYRIENSAHLLNLSNYSNDVNTYYRKIIDINDSSAQELRKIFSDVDNVDNRYSKTIRNNKQSLAELRSSIDKINRSITPKKVVIC